MLECRLKAWEAKGMGRGKVEVVVEVEEAMKENFVPDERVECPQELMATRGCLSFPPKISLCMSIVINGKIQITENNSPNEYGMMWQYHNLPPTPNLHLPASYHPTACHTNLRWSDPESLRNHKHPSPQVTSCTFFRNPIL